MGHEEGHKSPTQSGGEGENSRREDGDGEIPRSATGGHNTDTFTQWHGSKGVLRELGAPSMRQICARMVVASGQHTFPLDGRRAPDSSDHDLIATGDAWADVADRAGSPRGGTWKTREGIELPTRDLPLLRPHHRTSDQEQSILRKQKGAKTGDRR